MLRWNALLFLSLCTRFVGCLKLVWKVSFLNKNFRISALVLGGVLIVYSELVTRSLFQFVEKLFPANVTLSLLFSSNPH